MELQAFNIFQLCKAKPAFIFNGKKIYTMNRLKLSALLVLLAPLGLLAQKKIIYINHETQNCTGVAPQKCLQYRYKPTETWKLLYGGIKGFSYEPGYNYKLQITETKLKKPAADQSNVQRKLVKILSKEAVMRIALPHQDIGGEWKIMTIYNAGKSIDLMAKNIYSNFDTYANKISGKAGCNGYGGRALTGKGNTITISEIVSTKMACPDLHIENMVLQALQQATNYEVDENRLVLSKNAQTLIELRRMPRTKDLDAGMNIEKNAANPRKFDGVPYKFLKMNSGTETTDMSKLNTFIVFNSTENKANGKAACNRFFGNAILTPVSENKGTAQMDKFGGTMMACPDLPIENLMMKGIEMVDAYELNGDMLLLKKGDQVLFELTKNAN